MTFSSLKNADSFNANSISPSTKCNHRKTKIITLKELKKMIRLILQLKAYFFGIQLLLNLNFLKRKTGNEVVIQRTKVKTLNLILKIEKLNMNHE